jgi:dCTP diphosphatase
VADASDTSGADWIRRVQDDLRAFAQERDWEQFHTPRNLLLALVGEVGELAEIYQWRQDDEAPIDLVSAEVADIAIYLLRFADIVGIDLDQAIRTKMAANAVRYRSSEWRGRAGKADPVAED